MNKYLKAICALDRAGSCLQSLTSEDVQASNYDAIAEGALAIEESLPVVKGEDGKDVNAKERNGYLSSLRVRLLRAGNELPEPLKLTVKKVEGEWQVVASIDAPSAELEGEGENADAGNVDDGNVELEAALALVIANIDCAYVRRALMDALKVKLT